MKRLRTCYLCGSKETTGNALTRDHIPPISFFPAPTPTNLITVLCCQNCHKALCKDDEYFRSWVAFTDQISGGGKQIYGGPVTRALAKNRKQFNFFKDNASVKTVRTMGRKIPVAVVAFPEERGKAFLVRITKGLLRTYYPEYDYSSDVFYALPYQPIVEHSREIEELRPKLTWEKKGDGIFEFGHGIVTEKCAGLWILIFYGAARFRVIHSSLPFDKPPI